MDTNVVNLFHRKPKDFIGKEIIPLNKMSGSLTVIAEKHFPRYADRPELLKREVEPLKCLWNDVVHFSPIHPAKVRAALEEASYKDLPHFEYFVIPLSSLDPSRVAYVVSELGKYNPARADMPQDFMQQAADIPVSVKEYYQQEFNRGDFPLIYAGTLHVLYKGSVNVENAEVISV